MSKAGRVSGMPAIPNSLILLPPARAPGSLALSQREASPCACPFRH